MSNARVNPCLPRELGSVYSREDGSIVTKGNKKVVKGSPAEEEKAMLVEFARQLIRMNPIAYDSMIEDVKHKADIAGTVGGLITAAAAGLVARELQAPDVFVAASIFIAFFYAVHEMTEPIKRYLKDRELRALIREVR